MYYELRQLTESHTEEILYHFLSQVMIDSVQLILSKQLRQVLREFL